MTNIGWRREEVGKGGFAVRAGCRVTDAGNPKSENGKGSCMRVL